MIVVYDSSFEGFLTLIYKVYYEKLKPSEIKRQMPQTLFLDEIVEIQTDMDHADKVLKGLNSRFEKENLDRIFHIFMCDSREFELSLLEYIIIGFKDQKQLSNINISAIDYILNLEKELFSTVHKMYGFVRFEELKDGTLYAKIDNKFNIAYFLGKHFLKRLNNQNFIIHDIKRELAFLKMGEDSSIQKVSDFDMPTYSVKEEKFQKLWKRFFSSVTIESRENKRAQRNFVPFIYRTYMNEFSS